MKLKNAAVRSVVIIVLVILSIIAGYIYSRVWHRIDLNNYPREFYDYVTESSADYGVPEYIVYAVIKTESEFTSNKVSESGRTGLMQLSQEMFNLIQTMMKTSVDSGILYDPKTNIDYGTYYLSYLYYKYSRWTTVFCAYKAGEYTVDRWLSNPEYIDETGNLTTIPDSDVKKYVDEVTEAVETYKELYYN